MERTFVFHMCEIRRLLSLSSQLRCQNTIKKEKKEKTIGDALKLLSLFYTNKIKVKKNKNKNKNTTKHFDLDSYSRSLLPILCVHALQISVDISFGRTSVALSRHRLALCVYTQVYFPERVYIPHRFRAGRLARRCMQRPPKYSLAVSLRCG